MPSHPGHRKRYDKEGRPRPPHRPTQVHQPPPKYLPDREAIEEGLDELEEEMTHMELADWEDRLCPPDREATEEGLDEPATRYAVFGLDVQQYWAVDELDGLDVWRPLSDPNVRLFDSVTDAATALLDSVGGIIGPVAIHRIFERVVPEREIGGVVE